MSREGWICPKCRRVYAVYISECKHCNDEVEKGNNRRLKPAYCHPDNRSIPVGGADK